MPIVTPGVEPASTLVRTERPAWLDRWARFAATLEFHDIPDEAVSRARLVLLDCIGVIAAGLQEPELRRLTDRLIDIDGAGTVPVIGTAHRAAPGTAAFLHGTAGTTLELDEGNQYARGHPAIHVVPAALALASRRDIGGDAVLGEIGGDALLRAIVLGYEIGSRIGIASRLHVTMHPHGTWGVVGAALTAAALHGADADAIAETINIASSLGLATSRRTMLEGATVRNSYAGFANQLGLQAWTLVQSGFVGEADGIGTVYGSIIADDFSPDLMTDELGTRWEIARNYFKRHAACRYTHGALDALAEIVGRAGPLEPAQVAAIEVDTYVWAAQLDHPRPRNMLAAKFSLPFALATALRRGGATVDAFRSPALGDPATLDLARRVTVREDPALTATLPGLRPARLLIRMLDGTEHRAEVTTNRGDTEAPYTPDEVEAKFFELAGPVWGLPHGRRIRDAVMTLGQDDMKGGDTATLLRLLGQDTSA